MGEKRRSEMRDAVEAHQSGQREEVRRGETVAGRRLTAAELAEMREQLRQQWALRADPLKSGGPTEVVQTGPPAPPNGVQVSAPSPGRH